MAPFGYINTRLEEQLLVEAPAEADIPAVTQITEADEAPGSVILDCLKRIERPQGEMARTRKNQRPEGTGSNDLRCSGGRI